jgi:predicted nucleic acid-binding protein
MGLIYLDACLLIYAIEEHPQWAPRVRAALAAQAGAGFAISPLVKLECLVRPIKLGDLVLQRRYEEGLAHLTLLEMNDAVFMQAAQLRARFALKTPDALHLACAQHHGCAGLWTNDDRLAAAAHGLARNLTPVG